MEHHEETENKAWIYNGKDEVPPASVRRVKIAENVRVIPDEAFLEHPQLEEVIISSSVQLIGNWAFRDCEKLKSILYQGPENEEVGIPPTVKVIKEGAFDGCTSLARLVLNEGLERIGRNAFAFCDSLTEVETPSTVEVIDELAFQDCTLLARIVLNEGLERIGENAFLECESLSHVRVPRSVNSISTHPFRNCSSLISIELPEECSLHIDLSRCHSLVNLAGPGSVSMATFREEFFQSSKLGSL
eukprot:scaffold7537_cov79-Cylindrotheca_fusiformis.AAC.1